MAACVVWLTATVDRKKPAASRRALAERLGGFLGGFRQNLAFVVVPYYTVDREINRCKDSSWSTSATNIVCI
jgi:hypothetical protein